MSNALDLANTQLITDTRLASCYRALGFPYQAEVVIHERTEKARVQFLFQMESIRFPSLHAGELTERWKSGELTRKEPLHPLCVMMWGQHNYDSLLTLQKEGKPMRLVSVAGGLLTRYEPGELPTSLTMAAVREPCEDLCLTACLGLVGIPVVGIRGNEAGRHVYEVARYGHPVLLSNGERHLHDAQVLMRRAPTAADPYRLALEDTQPMHPLCIGYDGLHNRQILKRELDALDPMLLMDKPAQRLTGAGDVREVLSAKQAFISGNAPGYVMDHVTKHLGSPPIAWAP